MLQVECGAGSRSKTVLTVIALLSFLLVLPCLAVEEETRRQFMFGQRLFNEEKFTLAALQFQKFLDTFPDDPNCDKAQYYIGMSFWNLGDYERAASAFEIPLERYPESELVDESLLQLGESFYKLEEYDEAISSYRKLRRDCPETEYLPQVLYSIGYAQLMVKNYQQALSTFRVFKERFPESEYLPQVEDVIANITSYSSAESDDDVLRALEVLQDKFPESLQISKVEEAQYIIATRLYDEKRYPEAINAFTTFISSYPNSKYRASAHLKRGLAYLAEGGHSKARDDLIVVGGFLDEPETDFLPFTPCEENLAPKTSFHPQGDLTYQENKGPVGGRRVLRSVEPEYPAWAEASGVKGEVELKFWVTPAGEVSEVEVWKTSGWSEFDNSASQALREWKFEPIEEKERQWGIISFVFEFE